MANADANTRRHAKWAWVPCLTGALLVNTLLLALLTGWFRLGYVLGAALATQCATTLTFVLADRRFARRERPLQPGSTLTTRLLISNVALALRIPPLYALVTGLGLNYLVGNVISLLALEPLRLWHSRRTRASREPGGSFRYDMHGILTIVSDVRLPELERFAVDASISDPTVRLRLDHVRTRGAGAVKLAADRTRIHYAELGGFGFGAEIDLSERIEIVARPLLGSSPHVLYTKVVEPVLRWAFVERGYALVVAACMASDQHGFLIVASPATCRTVTVLETLDRLPYSFLSGPLTLVAADGRMLTYPEPLTVSRRTLTAVERPLLRQRERLALVIQSRLHSPFGRRLGVFFATLGLPAATLNTLVQLVVPPPRYPVERLLPHAPVAAEARLASMMIFRREGENGYGQLAEAIEMLLPSNEEADGVPPERSIQRWLYKRAGVDLRDVEREIVIRAIADTPVHVLRNDHRSWERIQSIVEQSVHSAHAQPLDGAANAAPSRPSGEAVPSS
jgi:putative flippase GtrA